MLLKSEKRCLQGPTNNNNICCNCEIIAKGRERGGKGTVITILDTPGLIQNRNDTSGIMFLFCNFKTFIYFNAIQLF